jgi:hypothetical protein
VICLLVAKTAVFGENNRPATKNGKCYYINLSRVKVVTVGMRITTLIARVDQEWKSRATGNIEHKRYKTTTTHPPKKYNKKTTQS